MTYEITLSHEHDTWTVRRPGLELVADSLPEAIDELLSDLIDGSECPNGYTITITTPDDVKDAQA